MRLHPLKQLISSLQHPILENPIHKRIKSKHIRLQPPLQHYIKHIQGRTNVPTLATPINQTSMGQIRQHPPQFSYHPSADQLNSKRAIAQNTSTMLLKVAMLSVSAFVVGTKRQS